MKKNLYNKVLKPILILCVSVLAIICLMKLSQLGKVDNYREKYEGVDLLTNVEGVGREDTYANYLKEAPKNNATKDIEVDLKDSSIQEGVSFEKEYFGQDNILMTEDDSYVEWEVNVKEDGLYNVLVNYYPVQSRGTDIERVFYVNGKVPFIGADKLVFPRLWGDGAEVKKDNQGNDIRPTQIEIPDWNKEYLKDYMGYEVKPYAFYLKKGTNKIALEAVNEPMAIKSITLEAISEVKGYTQYIEETSKLEVDKVANTYIQKVQGENSAVRTSPSLYATYDRSSPATEPYSVSKITLNMGGGYAYRVAGQWIEWDIEVPADGYYYVDIKARQNYQRGFVSNRSVYIDGEIPFKELEAVPFRYSNQWEQKTLGTEEEDAKIYLTQGKHTVRLQVTLGDLGEILSRLEDSVFRLNEIYRKILVLTGTEPDQFRDYKIDEVYPEVIEGMDLESKRLYKIVDDVVDYADQKASQVAIAQTLAVQLENFVEDPYDIPKTLVNFKANISALGTSILAMSESPLDIDSITVRGVDIEKEKVKVNFIDSAIHETKSFVASFFEDYDAVGNVYEGQDVIDVWLLAGRDQSTVLKNMADDDFIPNSGIKVNVKLVEAASLLNAVIAGTGPDVVLTIGQGEPVNYALRNAVEDLSQFDDCDEVLSKYHESAYTPFELEGGIYAIPEQQFYNVLFYREDILEELGLNIPETWEELINILPIIQQNNMSVAIPSSMAKLSPDPATFLSMMYQNGGELYTEDGKEVMLGDAASIKAFEDYTKFFTHYKLPEEYDFVNRFRSGEIPIGVQPYNMYNTLAVFAPEIRGLWNFAPLPGTIKEDGSIDRSGYGSSIGSMMLKQEEQGRKEACWEFMKWWADTNTQVRFGREMESILGSSARYATANIEAFEQLPWSAEQKEILGQQWEWVRGTEQVAGGYYTFRHITNAVRNVVNTNGDGRETLLDYARTINEEIEKKRLEFDLDVD